jgi:hypothetical protein
MPFVRLMHSIATGGANQFPGGWAVYLPLWTTTFHGAPDLHDLPGHVPQLNFFHFAHTPITSFILVQIAGVHLIARQVLSGKVSKLAQGG